MTARYFPTSGGCNLVKADELNPGAWRGTTALQGRKGSGGDVSGHRSPGHIRNLEERGVAASSRPREGSALGYVSNRVGNVDECEITEGWNVGVK
jgi:hypothetical protein